MAPERRVALAPAIDLHTGYHGAILQAPPSGFRILPCHALHSFVLDQAGDLPHAQAHLGEFIQVAAGADLVHSARWPVLGAPAWVADTDDLMYPVLCGRSAEDAGFRARLRDSSDTALRGLLRRRVENMLAAYAHPSCAGVLLRGRAAEAIAVARSWLESLDIPPQRLAGLLERIVPVRPAQRAADAASVRAKWNGTRAMRVLFCGRDFDAKNGLLALEVMARLRARLPAVEFTYVGPIPDPLARSRPELLHGVRHHPWLGHGETLREMLAAHVMFHPSRGESIGIVLLEAMGAGLAVVAARGTGMGYCDELFATGGALLLDRDRLAGRDEAAGFEALVARLLADRALAEALAMRNHGACSEGEFSIREQNRSLADCYQGALDRPSRPLRLDDLPHVAGRPLLRLSSLDVLAQARRSRERQAAGPGYLALEV